MLTENEKVAFEHMVMTIFLRTPSKITSYNADEISASAYLQIANGDAHSLHISARDGEIRWHWKDVDDYSKNFVENLINCDKLVDVTFKICQ